MRLWRLTRARFAAFDGMGPAQHGARYSSPGRPVVNFASEAGLAVLVVLRYLPRDLRGIDDDYVLGWTDVDAVPERIAGEGGDAAVRAAVDAWIDSGRSLLAAVRSQVLPEADVVIMNVAHPDAGNVPLLTLRPFSFAECLHSPPMLERSESQR
jgi:hypothetical protein